MNAFFEFIYHDQRYIAFDRPRDGQDLDAYHYMPGYLHEVLGATEFSFSRYKERIVDGTPRRVFTAEMLAAARLVPPMLPPQQSSAMVSGFGLSNKGKVNAPGQGAAPYPSWFFKGNGSILKVNGDPLTISASAIAVCEEAELVLVYVNDADGKPHYIGFTVGNDVTDMGTIKSCPQGFSYAKLSECAVSEMLFIKPPPLHLTGRSRIYRERALAWEGNFSTGIEELYYPIPQMLGNLFKHPSFQLPGMVNYIYIGADRNSYDGGFRTLPGDVFELEFDELDLVVRSELAFQARQELQLSPFPEPALEPLKLAS